MYDLSIVIGDENQAYSKQLSNYLRQSSHYQFSIQTFSDSNQCIQFLKHNSVQIVLITQIFYDKIFFENYEGLVVLLVEKQVKEVCLGLPKIFKYQKGLLLEQAITKLYYEKYNGEYVNLQEKTGDLISVYSPIGGCGKTTIATSLSTLLVKKGLKVLYLSLEDIGSFKQQEEGNMSDLIFYIKKQCQNMNVKVQSLVKIHEETKVNYIAPCYYAKDLHSLYPEEMIRFLNYLKDVGWYDKIVIDLSSAYNALNQSILEVSDQVLILGENEEHIKYMQFLRYLENEGIGEKVVKIINKSDTEKRGDLVLPWCKEMKDEEYFMKGIMNQNFVRNLMKV